MKKRLCEGEQAPLFTTTDWKGRDIDFTHTGGQATLLCFFRYASCPLCNLRIRDLIRQNDQLKERRVRVLAVFQSPSEKLARYVGRQQPPFPLIPDPYLVFYRLYGVETSWLGFFRAWTFGIADVGRAVLGNRFLPGTVENEINRIPADFLISPDGHLAIAYYGKDIGDHVPLEQVFDKAASMMFS